MRAAVVGLGTIGRVHARILRERGELWAVCDCDPSRLDEFEGFSSTTDYVQLLEELRPEVVHICTPHYLHAPMVIAALERGIHVLCEKPLCISVEEIEKILAAERASDATLGVCFQNRYNEANRFVKEYLRGRTKCTGTAHVTWRRSRSYYEADAWRGRKNTEGGGVLINQAIHTVDLLQWFLGMPKALAATTATLELADAIEVEDTAAIVASEGADFSLYATNASAEDFWVEINLRVDGARVRVLPYEVTVDEEHHVFPRETVLYGKPCYGGGHALLINDFYNCIAEGRRFPIDGNEGAKALRLVLAAYQSQGKKIAVEN